jgi:hypothetical protein
VSSEAPKFNKGDLVFVANSEGLLHGSNVGIIVSEPILMILHVWETTRGMPNKFWSYNIVIDGRLFKELPENILRGFNDEDEKDSK